MIKKISVIIIAITIFFMPVQNGLFPNEADAFISKLMGLSAKKIAKEVAKDIAVETAANFAINEAFKIADAQMQKYNQQEAYKIVCLYKMTGEVCDKPIAIKENLTEADKISIAHQAELELDKLVSPEGRGFTRWQKFMDWFGPVWLTSAIMTVITYAIDSDVRTLFNEAGYNALVALGLITPVTEISNDPEDKPLEEVELPQPTIDNGTEGDLLVKAVRNYYSSSLPTIFTGLNIPNRNLIFKTEYFPQPYAIGANIYHVEMNNKNLFNLRPQSLEVFASSYVGLQSLTVAKNGVVLKQILPTNQNGTTSDFALSLDTQISTNFEKMRSIMTRSPYTINGFMYTDILFDTTDGNVFTFQMKHTGQLSGDTLTHLNTTTYFPQSTPRDQRTTIYTNQTKEIKILVPSFEGNETKLDLMDNSSYQKDGNIALVPPSALPMTQTSTGKKISLQPNPTPGGEPIATNEDGEIVQDEDITVGDPVVTPSPTPEGSPTVTPQPSPSNPTPQPQPLTPTPPPVTQTPVETAPPVFPEGESCSEGLKFPKFKQLGSTVSNAFPFSLPFDIYDGFNNVFSGIGTEKPKFEYKFNFMGDEQVWKIALPDYFDSWKKFTDITLIVFFDITLLYLFNRFFGAMGSD